MIKTHTENDSYQIRHSNEMQDIITAVPRGLVRWGMFLFLCVLAIIIGVSSFIHYPEVVRTNLKINLKNSSNPVFFGEVIIPEIALQKVHNSQVVLIKLNSYPFEQYGILKGKIKYLYNTATKDGAYMADVEISTRKGDINHAIHLKSGMMAEADIIIQNVNILQRIGKDMFKVISDK